MTKSISKLDKAKAQIVLDHPFFSSILLRKQLIEDPTVPTLAVDARGNIYYNADFIDSLTVPQIVWGLCHEIGHVIAQHANRRGSRDPKKWNYAGDAWINDMLNDSNVGQSIPNTVDMPGSKDKTTEQIYDELPDDGNGGSGGGGGSNFDNGLGDEFKDTGPLTQSELDEIEAQAKVEIAQAAQAAKARGKLSGKLAEVVADIINVKIPWYDILERYMNGFTQQDYTWSKPNRRFASAGYYLPSTAKVPTMGEIVIQKDISGSMSANEDAYFNGHIKRIIEQCNPSKVHVLYTDSEVKRHEVFERGQEVKFTYHSGGGTDMCAGIQYVEDQGIDASVIITLTDGYTDFPKDTNIPTVWCISSDKVSSVGETVHFEMEAA